ETFDEQSLGAFDQPTRLEVGEAIELREALERLVTFLPPRQAVIVLLIEGFQFTSAEAAAMLQTTEGAVYSALHRARAKLKQIAREDRIAQSPAGSSESQIVADQCDPKVIQAYMDAINRGDAQAMLALMSENVH
ncbi:ECF-type sigma factor, partial [Frankia sp. Cpl3]|nr:ECF-type sigma factor [Frankia sp. Cpl3]